MSAPNEEDLPGDHEFPTPDSRFPTTDLDRRSFLRMAAATAAASTLGVPVAAAAIAQDTRPPAQGVQPQQALPALGNGEPPALQFQPYPGGTGAYVDRLARERGHAAFERAKFDVEPWKGAVPTSEEEIAFLPVHRLSALIKAKKITSVQLTDIYLARLKRLDPTLLCAVTIMEPQAREAAQQADADFKAGRYRGPLHGIPWGVKDLFAVKGTATTWGSKEFESRVIDDDSEVVVRLREAGAVLIAKLATGLFAQGDNWFRGQTKNPWNTTQGSSGSSAGPSSATAAGCVAFGIGTETQGSIVSPARRCGLSALRPTFGRVSRYGGMVLAWSMDKVGPICRTVEDCALVFNTLHGADEKDPSTVTAPFHWQRKVDLSKLRIGYDDQAPKEFVETLRSLGAAPKPIGARPGTTGLNSLGVESAAAFDAWVASQPAAATAPAANPPATAADSARAAGSTRFTRGRTVTALDFLQSQRRRLIVMRQMDALMKDFDMYVSGSGDVGLTNQTGHPAVVVPYMVSEGEHAQPQCTTIVGSLFADDMILAVAHMYQTATNWHLKHPALA
jgi:Asp-tRNA(Asn)/Glu-tRNA(Gln) amidotransferase A subunit family amidase